MAKKDKQNRSDEIFLGLLMSLPWWVPFALAALAYIALSRITILGAFLWACILVFAGLIIPFIKLRMTELLMTTADLSSIRQLSWQNFERLVGEAYRRQGYVVVELGGSGPDGGVDLILHKRTEKIVVQCKHWHKSVGVTPVRELRGVVAREKAKRGIFVTSSSYTEEALAEAKGQPLELIDGTKLCKLLREVRSRTTLEVPLCPKCNALMEIKIAKKGPHAGKELWGCTAYPHCLGRRQVDLN